MCARIRISGRYWVAFAESVIFLVLELRWCVVVQSDFHRLHCSGLPGGQRLVSEYSGCWSWIATSFTSLRRRSICTSGPVGHWHAKPSCCSMAVRCKSGVVVLIVIFVEMRHANHPGSRLSSRVGPIPRECGSACLRPSLSSLLMCFTDEIRARSRLPSKSLTGLWKGG